MELGLSAANCKAGSSIPQDRQQEGRKAEVCKEEEFAGDKH